MQPTEQIQITIRKEGVKPDNLSASDLAEVIAAAEKAVNAIVRRDYPGLTGDDSLVLSLTDVEDSSVGLPMHSSIPELQVPAFALWTHGIEEDAFDGLPRPALEGAKSILKVSKRLGAEIELRSGVNGSEAKTLVTPISKITEPSRPTLRGETVIYGEIESIGGADPKVKLRQPGSTTQTILTVDKETAKSLGRYLYTTVGIRGEATWDAETREILVFKVKDIINFEGQSLSKTLARIGEIAAPFYNEIEDPIAYFRRS